MACESVSSFGTVEPEKETVGFAADDGVVTLWRPVGVHELSLIVDSGQRMGMLP